MEKDNNLINRMLFLTILVFGVSYFSIFTNSAGIFTYGKWVMLVITIIVLSITLRNLKVYLHKVNFEINNSFILIIAFFLFGVLSTVRSMNSTTTILTEISVGVSVLFVYLLTCYVKTNADNLYNINEIFYRCLILVIVFALVFGINDILDSIKNYDQVIQWTGRLRIKGLFQHANGLASICFVGIVCLFDNLNSHLNKRSKYKIIGIAFLGIVLCSTVSRTAMVCIGLFFFIYFFTKNIIETQNQRKRFLKSSVILFSIIVGAITLFVVLLIYWNMPYDPTNSISDRIYGWKEIIANVNSDVWTQLFGCGLTNTGNYIVGALNSLKVSSDNSFIILYFQLGISGVALLLCFIFYYINSLLKIYYCDRYEFSFKFALFISFIFYSSFENIFFAWGNIITIYVWFRLFLKREKSNNNILYKQELGLIRS